jgi:uncharacterized membrane protein
MQCPACNNEVANQTAFCTHCGAPMGAAATPGGTAVQPVAASSGLSDNAAGAIAYITIIPAIIFLVLEPYNRIPFVKFHSWQSIGLCVAAFIIQILVMIADGATHFIPGMVFLFMLIHLAVGLGLFLVWLFVILKASKGEWYKLPFIGDFAEKQARS